MPDAHRLLAQKPDVPSQSASVLQNPLMQCLPGPLPSVQSAGPVPALPPSVVVPVIAKRDAAPSGMRPGGTTVAFPPPK